MSYVLDTTALSALMRSEPSHASRLVALSPGDVRIPQPALAEVRYGLARLGRTRRRRELEERLELLLATIARAPWDDDVSRSFGELKAALERRGARIDDMDAIIAAHALAATAVLVTSNTRHFARVPGLLLEDWSRSG